MNKISLLNSTDLDQAWAIEQRCHAVCWNRALFSSNSGEHYLNYRIDVAGVMAGFAITQLAADEASLFNLAIDPPYRRQGLARQLLSYIIEQLVLRHVTTIWLEVRASNHPAQQLYQQLGFNEVTVRHDYYQCSTAAGGKTREDAIIMALPLRL